MCIPENDGNSVPRLEVPGHVVDGGLLRESGHAMKNAHTVKWGPAFWLVDPSAFRAFDLSMRSSTEHPI